jgi:hypothetical protein
METSYRKLMIGKSDEDLQKYIDHKATYTPEAVEYAIDEMQNRGRVFSDAELIRIRREIQLKKEADEAEENEAMKEMDANVVTDRTAPAYYSQAAIFAFGIFFSLLFSAVLLAININKAGSKKGGWQVIIFGLIYSAIQVTISVIWFMNTMPRKYSFIAVVGGLGALLMNEIFWRKYIGKDTKYRAKPIWKPLIIGVIIFTPFVFAVIYGSTY